MTKAEFIDKLFATKAVPTKAMTEKALNATIDVLMQELLAGNDITFTGFGSFKIQERKARKGRNPRTSEEIEIPACKVVKFIPSKNLKDGII